MTDRKEPEKYTPLPRNPNNRVDKKLIQKLYAASKHIEWLPFCQENGWNPQLARLWCPAQKWVEEKRRLAEDEMASQLRALQLEHRKSWIKDVAATLEHYPKAVDNVMFLVQKWIASEFRKGADATPAKPSHLYAVAETVKKCIDAKKSILLISDAVVSLTPRDPEAPKDGEDGRWTMEIRGMKKPSVKEVQELFARYIDRPMSPPLPEPARDSAEGGDAEA